MPTPTDEPASEAADESGHGSTTGAGDEPVRVAFVCVQNAGRSQMATAFAEQAVADRGLRGRVDVVTGGTDPADRVHDEVVAAMRDVGVDLSDRTPREVTPDDLADCDYVVTMGCDAASVCPATWSGDNRDWGLDDPDGADPEAVAAIRDDIRDRVAALFDELDASGAGRADDDGHNDGEGDGADNDGGDGSDTV